MAALLMGLVAALAWGVHDLLVRRIAQGAEVMPMVAVEMAVAALWTGLLAVAFGSWDGGGAWPAMASGVIYCVGIYGLYKAFALAPVRLVTPIMASFPLLSLALAVAEGRTVTPGDWLASVAVVGGIVVVAAFYRADGMSADHKGRAMLWALVGAAGFGGSFAFGQMATRAGDSLTMIALGRATSVVVMALVVVAGRYPLAPLRPFRMPLVAIGTLDGLALALVFGAGHLPHAEYAAVTASLFGVVTILLAWRFLGEKVSPGQWFGIAVIFAAVAKLSAG
ncbi:MAG: DMT family transporter [bacterium]